MTIATEFGGTKSGGTRRRIGPGSASGRSPAPSAPKPLRLSPGARKEVLRRRTYSPRKHRPGYAELHAASAFSFLDGSSQPEDLVAQAAQLGLPAVALVDTNGVYGAPRFYKAAKQAGIKPLVGAEVVLCPEGESLPEPHGLGALGGLPGTETAASSPSRKAARLTLLVASREGYRNLCRLLTAAARHRPKGEARADWAMVAAHAEGLHCLTGGEEGPLARLLETRSQEARTFLERLHDLFPERLHMELQRHRLPPQEHRNQALLDLAARLRLPVVATNGVRYARKEDKALHDALGCIRRHTAFDLSGRHLPEFSQRHLKGAEEMAELFKDLPRALEAGVDLADRLSFTLKDLSYRFPDYPLPAGETADSFLHHMTWNGARSRFRPLTAKAQAQIEKELRMIEKLGLAGYFLIVWDVVCFCQRHGILAQGRGSAANSAVCYALSITAVDPVRMELLFERFLSEERGEWPDIDLDLPSGTEREQVIQYVYQRYGPHGAAMTANVITYRDRSAAREIARTLGFSRQQEDRLSRRLGTWRSPVPGVSGQTLEQELSEAGLDPADDRVRLFAQLWTAIQNTPRHLGQHSGGMVIAAGRLDEIVPLEPAAMPGRMVVQWDKDDCADLGIIKVDLLGLGMLRALEVMAPLIRTHEGIDVNLAHLPVDDPKTYKMLQEADTAGVFQLESRAQMASLPRNRPERFYDLVIQVAIIRPGPIVGGMVHPFFERRRGRLPVEYPHPSLEPILQRTLGVPLFQEQLLRIAMVAAGFTGGEAEELRRAMGFKRSAERMETLERRLRLGMQERGITGAAQDQIIQSITSFALYGFPESHAASFALIAYASAYLKAHHPTAFLLGLLNSWPMGFYHPATLIKDAERHGVETRPIDVQVSGWDCRWEESKKAAGPAGAVRLGLRYVRGLRRESGARIEAAQPFTDLDDFHRRCGLAAEEMNRLAQVGAFGALGQSRRQALWQIAWLTRPAGRLLEDLVEFDSSPLPEMSALEQTAADFQGTGMTTGPHPLHYLRKYLTEQGVVPQAALTRLKEGTSAIVAGSVIVRQRPGTAKGMLFITLEDETGMVQAILGPDLVNRYRNLLTTAAGLGVKGKIQKKDGTLSIKAETLWSLNTLVKVASHDFH